MKPIEARLGLAILTLAIAAAPIGAAGADSVDQAYAEMGHRHAALDPSAAAFPPDEAAFLSRLFDLVDRTIVEKTQAWTWFQSEGRKGKPPREYSAGVDALLGRLAAAPVPPRLKEIHRLILEAIRDQRAFFAAWERAEALAARGEDNRGAHRERGASLQSSSRKLHQAYDLLVALYPGAGQRNLDAFYDHLCVLDLL
jgi:hypothetical protein